MTLDLTNPTVKALGYSVFAVVALLAVGSLFEGDEARPMRVREDTRRSPRPKKRPISKVAKKAARVAERQGDDDLAGRLERGEIRGEELAALMRGGSLRRQNPDGSALVAKAVTESEEFHGNKSAVVALNAKDRYVGPIGVVVGTLDALTYSAPNNSERAGLPWEHRSGDRGTWQPPGKKKMLVVADAENGHIHLIQNRSSLVLKPDVGLYG